MKKLMTLAAAAGALAGMQAVAASPAAAWDYCNPYYGYYYSAYYAGPGCCGGYYYAPARYYAPVVRRAVRTVTYYRVVGYRPVRAYRSCCR
jgi:hypothetical protein